MKSFYSIIYVPLRPEVKEILTIGLLMRDEKQVILRYSKNKLNVLKELLPKETYHLLKLSLQSIERTVLNANEDFNKSIDSLLPANEIDSSVLSEPYIKYLSTYSKNLITFTAPEPFELPVTFDLYKTLFGKMVADGEFISEKTIQPEDIVIRTKALLIPKIKDRVNIDYQVTSNLFNKLILPSITIDFIGKNGKYVTGQAINFTKRDINLEADITKQIALMDAMRSENGGCKCFVLGKEPNKKQFPLQHELWENVKNSSTLEFVDTDEYQKVSEYIISHDVHPVREPS
jgi:hypothetical protein